MSPVGLVPSEGPSGGSVPCLFQSLVAAGVLGLWPHNINLRFGHHFAAFSSLVQSPSAQLL